MKFFTKENIFMALIGLLVLGQTFDLLRPSGYSEDEVEFKIKIHDLQQEKKTLTEKNDSLESNNKNLKDAYIEINPLVSNYTDNQTDSFFANFHRQ